MNELFENTYEELRGNFVRARFGEDNIFGREDIEEWLEEQPKMLVPGREWVGIIDRHADEFSTPEVEDLFSEDIPSLFQEYGSRDTGHWSGTLKMMIGSISPDECWETFFCGNDTYAITHPVAGFVVFSETGSDGEGFYQTHTLSKGHLLCSAFEEWYVHGQGDDVPSRDFLCEWLKRVIAHVRKEAEADFDRAVACSADGRKIIHADEVWIVERNNFSRKTLRPTDGETKILLGSNSYGGTSVSHQHKKAEDAWPEAVAERRRDGHDCPLPDDDAHQVRAVFSDKRVFVTTSDFVPQEVLEKAAQNGS